MMRREDFLSILSLLERINVIIDGISEKIVARPQWNCQDISCYPRSPDDIEVSPSLAGELDTAHWGIIFNAEDGAAVSPWETASLEEDPAETRAWRRAYTIAFHLEDSFSKDRLERHASWIYNFFNKNIHKKTCHALLKLCKGGLRFRELSALLRLRQLWAEQFKGIPVPPYEWFLWLVRERRDFPVEDMIDPAWFDEWRQEIDGVEDSEERKRKGISFRRFIETKVAHSRYREMKGEFLKSIPTGPCTTWSGKLKELQVSEPLQLSNPWQELAPLHSRWDWPGIPLHRVLKGMEPPFHDTAR